LDTSFVGAAVSFAISHQWLLLRLPALSPIEGSFLHHWQGTSH
jgi:hypothetical protein